jgi:hypothetical protein
LTARYWRLGRFRAAVHILGCIFLIIAQRWKMRSKKTAHFLIFVVWDIGIFMLIFETKGNSPLQKAKN